MCCAVSPVTGVVHYEITLGKWDQCMFASFLTELMKSPFLQTFKILILDGVPWHKTPLIHSPLQGNPVQHRLDVLPAYSPHLNAIEYCFSSWKADIRKKEHTTTSNLRAQIEAARVRITDEYVSRCTHHVYRYYTCCMQGKPLIAPLPDVELDALNSLPTIANFHRAFLNININYSIAGLQALLV